MAWPPLVPWEPTTIARMFFRTAERWGGRDAVVQVERRLSYAALADEVTRLAHGLLDLGVAPGDRVGLWLPNYPEWIISNLAIASVRAVTVPINTRFRPREAEYVIKTAGISVMITTERFLTNRYLDMLGFIIGEPQRSSTIRAQNLPALRTVLCVDGTRPWGLSYRDLVDRQRSEPSFELKQRISAAGVDEPVDIFWTSGTTGHPKGAVISSEVLENIWSYSQILRLSADDRLLIPTPLFYVMANYWCMLGAIMNGACMLPLLQFTPEEALETIEREKATFTVGIPNTYLGYLRGPDIERRSLRSMRGAWAGGATMPLDLAEELVKKMGLEIFCQVYGMTETGGITTMTAPGEPFAEVGTCIGYPLPGFELRYVDSISGEDVPAGVEGELWVRGRLILKSYYGMSVEDAKAYFTSDGWFRTGDIILRDARGRHYFRSRIKDMMKVGGENVSAREVEMVLYSHPAVHQVAVVGFADAVGSDTIVAVVQTKETVTDQELHEYCRARLAPFKVPRRFLFRDALPMTPNGKIAKWELRVSVEDEVVASLDAKATKATR